MLQCPLKAGDVGGTQSLLARSLDNKQAVGKLGVDEPVHNLRRTVRAGILDDEDVELLLQREDGTNDIFDVLLLVVCGNDNYGVALMHGCDIVSFLAKL